jgi:transcriptional regulator with GAF, ATPase, and Fis domain
MSAHVTIAKLRARHQAAEKRLLRGALERNAWNVMATARDLGVRDTGLRAMIRAHGLDDLQRKYKRPVGRPRKTETK